MDQKINNPNYTLAQTLHEFTVIDLKGNLVKLDKYKGNVCIYVNTATNSPFTDMHYKQFNALMDKFADEKGLRILAFPCNQFGMEPGTPESIAAHAEKHNVKFDIFAKMDVNGETACDVWKFIKARVPGGAHGNMIKNNYTKFIVSKQGIPVQRYGPEVEPGEFEPFLNPYW
ncbi:hypothetical protein SFRURICE_014536 [Spodoptera frugiperda]|uniref:Glutathione peroxidase n=1 Tax=Spodoptera frugiperda TaxID=7108 RepID=A0A2H1X369_SPOFR|nr:hypothetical protein SFRURICE_014536 [Spodoptera frugiperda]